MIATVIDSSPPRQSVSSSEWVTIYTDPSGRSNGCDPSLYICNID